MASAAQALANHANAQKSTGPRTEAGKQNSKRNSVAHGLNSEAATLFAHSPYLAEEFQRFCSDLLEIPTQGKSEELAFDRWAFSAFQVTRARQLEAMAESDARINFGDDQFERRWHRMIQTRLRLEREAATARKEFLALQDTRLCMEAEQQAECKRHLSDKTFLRAIREKAKERNLPYQNALLAHKQRTAQTQSTAPEIVETSSEAFQEDFSGSSELNPGALDPYSQAALDSCRPLPIRL